MLGIFSIYENNVFNHFFVQNKTEKKLEEKLLEKKENNREELAAESSGVILYVRFFTRSAMQVIILDLN